jgi:tripartite-type tricarboxylate transporter receptor subunit TctC
MQHAGSLIVGSTLVVAGAIALAALADEAKAQAFPTRPVRLVVALAPGGPT